MLPGLHTVTPFLHAKNAPAFIEFLKRGLGALEEGRQESEGIVRHAQLRLGNAAIEVGEAQGRAQPMASIFYLYVVDADAVYNQPVAAGATPRSRPADQWYGDRSGSVDDSQGNTCYIARPARKDPNS